MEFWSKYNKVKLTDFYLVGNQLKWIADIWLSAGLKDVYVIISNFNGLVPRHSKKITSANCKFWLRYRCIIEVNQLQFP